MRISIVILTKNEKANIKRAINSARIANEILVIDDESTDETAGIAKSLGAQVYKRELDDDFAKQRNWAMEKVKGEWILFLDADEEVSEELAAEIKRVTSNESQATNEAYHIKRRDFWWGREVKFGETMKARKKGIIRLVKKDAGRFAGKIHESYETTKPVGTLDGYINHYPHQSVGEFLADINYYSSLRARELADQKVGVSILAIMFIPFFKFIYTYFILLGVLDGAAGFIYSFMMSFHSFLVRAKLYMMKHESRISARGGSAFG